MKIIITIFITIISFGLLSAQPGNLDETFNEEGQVITHFDGLSARPNIVRVQKDGKIVVAGSVKTDTTSNIIITRYMPNGTLDITFNKTGILFLDIYGKDDRCVGLELISNGKILLVGTSYTSVIDTEIILIQLNEDGSMDKGFGKDGIAISGLEKSSSAYGMLILDDKIIVTGRSDKQFAIQRDVLCKFDQDGTIDTSFGENGFVFHDNGYINWAFNLLQDNGKIVVGGFMLTANDSDVIIVRYNTDGSKDESFGENGIVKTDHLNEEEFISDGIIQSDGKLLISGGFRNSKESGFLIQRHNIDGSLDKTFGSYGRVRIDLFDDSSYSEAITLQEDEKILVVGSHGKWNAKKAFAMARLNTDGTLDTDFGESGILETEFTGNARALTVIIQPDRKILLAGRNEDESEVNSFALARYLSGLEVNTKNIILDQENLSLFPNPVQNRAIFKYTLNQDQEINIDLFDINGKWVQSFIQGAYRKKGTYQEPIKLDPKVGSGMYFLTINREVGLKMVIK